MKICIETDNIEKLSAYTEAERNVNTAEVRASLSGNESGSPGALTGGNSVDNSQTGHAPLGSTGSGRSEPVPDT